LEFQNRIIADALSSRIRTASNGGDVAKVSMTIADFDGVMYNVQNPDEENPNVITVSLKHSSFHQFEDHGATAYLQEEYGALMIAAEDGYDVTVQVDVSALTGAPEAIIHQVASLKRNLFAAVFDKYFKIQESGTAPADGSASVIKHRPSETMYISAHKDRVTVIFSTIFSDEDDIVFGKLFLQEFAEARARNQSAPQVLYAIKDPPVELTTQPEALTGNNVGYVTFVLFPRHIAAKCRDNSIDLVHTFRNYLHYHLKCSKAYLHSRMRKTTSDMLKVLNRAKPTAATTQRKTVSGRSFVRK